MLNNGGFVVGIAVDMCFSTKMYYALSALLGIRRLNVFEGLTPLADELHSFRAWDNFRIIELLHIALL